MITRRGQILVISVFKILCTFSKSFGLAPRATHLRAHSRRASVRSCIACVLCQRKDFIERRPAGCSPRSRPQTCVRSPRVDPSWTCWCTARLAHHKASPRRLQLGHCFCSRLQGGPFWESALVTNEVGHQAEKRQCFSRWSPARETRGNHFMQTTTPRHGGKV